MPLSRLGRHVGGLLLLSLVITGSILLAPTPLLATPTTECEAPDGKDTYGLEEPSWDGSLDYCFVSPPPTPTPQPTATPTPVVGKWRYSSRTDSLTGKQRHSAMLVATSRTGYGDETPFLYLRCTVGGPQWESYIAWREFIGGDSPSVSYRLGTAPVVALRWTKSTDSTATFLPRGRVLGFAQTLSDHGATANRRLVVRVWRYDDQTITAAWDIGGAVAAVQHLTTRCVS